MPPVRYHSQNPVIIRLLACIAFGFLLAVTLWILVPYRSTLAQKCGGSDDSYNKNYYKYYVHFQTSDNETLSGWFFYRGQESNLVVCFPGNYCNAGMYITFAEHDKSQSYLMLNYRGYGASTGRLNEGNMVSDACEAIRYYKNKYDFKSVKLLGFSLGTGVAIQVAARTSGIQKIVLAAPFSSMADTCGLSGIRKKFYKDHFNSLEHAPYISSPVYILYSEKDCTVVPESTKKLINALRAPLTIQKLLGTHNDIITTPANQEQIIKSLQE